MVLYHTFCEKNHSYFTVEPLLQLHLQNFFHTHFFQKGLFCCCIYSVVDVKLLSFSFKEEKNEVTQSSTTFQFAKSSQS